eukprot:bmy_18034T0
MLVGRWVPCGGSCWNPKGRVPSNLHKREIISPSQLLSFSKLPEPTSRAASRAADIMEVSVQEAMRRAHVGSAPSGPPTDCWSAILSPCSRDSGHGDCSQRSCRPRVHGVGLQGHCPGLRVYSADGCFIRRPTENDCTPVRMPALHASPQVSKHLPGKQVQAHHGRLQQQPPTQAVSYSDRSFQKVSPLGQPPNIPGDPNHLWAPGAPRAPCAVFRGNCTC